MTRALLAMLLLSPAPDALAQGAPSEAQADSGDIVVTAQRREERLQDVPVAVTAFGGEQLETRQVRTVVDLMTTVPNLHASNNIGQGSATTAFIRGVGETESIITVDTPVGFYLDDVYIGRQGVNNSALFDVERVEVLRGPQGTLYGRNTSAGAIKIVTRQPSFEAVEGVGEFSYGRFDTWQLRGSVGVPLSDRLALRVSALVGDGAGDGFNRTLDKRVNGSEILGFRPALRWAVSDDVELNLSGDWSRQEQNGRYGVDIAGLLRPPSGSIYVSSTDVDTVNLGKAGGANGTLSWNLSDTLRLKSISAWRYTTQRYDLDLTDQAPSLYLLYTQNRSEQFSQELQLSGETMDGALDFVAGFYYFNERSRSFLGDFIFQFLYFRKDLKVRTDSYAGFGQANWRFADHWSLILGGRYTIDDKSIDILQKFGGTPGFEDIGGIFSFDTNTVNGNISSARPDRPVKTDLNFKRFTPKAGIEYQPSRDFMAYFTYTKGFKSGGWSARVTDPDQFIDFDPETINSYELGLRASPMAGATVNLTGFYYDYKGLFTTGTRADGSFGIATSNAEIYGLELETAWRLARGVRAFANLAWQDGDRRSVSAATIALGERFQRFPRWSASVGVNASRELNDRFELLGSAEYSYTGEHYVNPQNTAAGLVPSVHLVNASIGIGAPGGRWQLVAGCRNCFGEEYINQILDFAALGFTTVYAGDRATWTITARTRF
ncbi:MAG: TonB-dependent receptor [Sphingomonadaceae bacterium]